MSISIFWKIAMENKIEMITINRNLVNNFFLLVIEEVFKELLLLFFVITLPHKCYATHLYLSFIKKRLVDYLVENVWVFCVSYLLINLPKFTSLQELTEHIVRSLLHRLQEVILSSTLNSFENVE